METKDIILELRTKKGLSQDELAEKVFVTRQAVSRWENGETTPNVFAIQDSGFITDDFIIRVSDADETIKEVLSPEETVIHLARIKGRAVSNDNPDNTVISADTVVS